MIVDIVGLYELKELQVFVEVLFIIMDPNLTIEMAMQQYSRIDCSTFKMNVLKPAQSNRITILGEGIEKRKDIPYNITSIAN